jgi:ribosome-associated toxin RatA of RatAB toxin-antitoxin module
VADERFKEALDQFVSETTNSRSKNLSAINNDADQMTALVNSFDKFKRFLNRCNKINVSLQQAARILTKEASNAVNMSY